MRRTLFLLALFITAALSVAAQKVTGTVTDEKTGEPLPYVNIYYKGLRGVQTDVNGRFEINFKRAALCISYVGYKTKVINLKTTEHLNIRLEEIDNVFREAVVKAKKEKYSRKNNPAVELMKKVIAAAKKSDLHQHDYVSINQYNKLVLALNDVKPERLEEGMFKKYPFLKDHVEPCNLTGRLILPISVDETVSRNIFRKRTNTEKTIILGQRSNGLNDLFNTGDIMTQMLQDCFTTVDLYENEVRLLQYPFTSPISQKSAINFYRYYITDTLDVDGERCIDVSFTPNNAQDFGFSGHLFVLADSTYRLKKADLGIPVRSDVNFVEEMRVLQEFISLPSGEQVLKSDNMIVQLKVAKFIQKFMVRRTTEYSDFSFEEIPDKTFKFRGDQLTDANAMMQTEEFWNRHRPEALSKSEDEMSGLIRKIQNIKGFKPVMWVAKAFIENFVETSVNPEHPSKVDIGPVNTMISQNFIDGLRFRVSAQTTANLSPHLFLRGYAAYGCKDKRWKGLGEVTYSFNKKAYLPREFPVNNLTFTYNNDVMSPSDKFLPTDKDNVFTSFKWTKVEHMQYYRYYKLFYDREWENGLRFNVALRTQTDEPTGALFYQPLGGSDTPDSNHDGDVRKFTTSDVTVGLRYQPGAKWINTKQRRIAANNDAPIYSLSHTLGVRGVFGSDYAYNFSEATIYKRFWLGSWGKMDAMLKGGIQWNQVPFPLLIMPAANLSYIMEDYTFNLVDNMEFLNDRYASLMFSWDMNGKIFNRIPLLKKLKWREFIGCNVLWGTLTDKNNPFLPQNQGNRNLYYFPCWQNADGTVDYLSRVMDKNTPYVEVIAGVHNIFKLFHIEYVRRLTYVDRPGTDKWGIRFMFRVTF